MATSTPVSISREARRRRIVERGSDRLALITGRTHPLPNEPTTVSTDSPPQCNATPIDSVLPSQGSEKETIQPNNVFNEAVESLLSRNEGSSIVSRAVSLLGSEKEFSQTLSSIQRPLLQHQNELQSDNNDLPATGCNKSITTGQIRSAISASENIRMFCAIAAAFLVLFSYTGFPVLGWGVIRGVMLFRPLFLLLLTNVSIAIARLVLGTQSRVLRAGQTSSVPMFGGSTFDQLGQALEVGLLLQSIFGALFIDFSVYAVVLLCGLSMIRSLGW